MAEHKTMDLLSVAQAIHAELESGEPIKPLSSIADRLSDALERITTEESDALAALRELLEATDARWYSEEDFKRGKAAWVRARDVIAKATGTTHD